MKYDPQYSKLFIVYLYLVVVTLNSEKRRTEIFYHLRKNEEILKIEEFIGFKMFATVE